MTVIRLQSKDGDIFEVDLEVVKKSVTLRTMLQHMGNEDDGEIISVPKVSSHIMRLVIDWSIHHVNDPVDEMEDDIDSDDDMVHSADDIDPWDRQLLDPLDTVTLFELIMACNYLNIRGLLAATSKTVANLIKGKSPAGIRRVFNIQDQGSSRENEDPASESSDCLH